MRPDGLGRVPTPRAALEILGPSDDAPCEAHVMDGFDPATSFGPAVAARYDDHLRGDESAAASFLDDGGVFVVETALPHAWIPPGAADYVHAEHVGLDVIGFDVARYDPVTQLLTENHVRLTSSGIEFEPIVCRLVTPGELDLMARIAGLCLVDRFADWGRSSFDHRSTAYVSVYGRR